jgi:hypothetical protein
MPDLLLGGAVDPVTHERTATDATGHVTIPTDAFTTHGVIVGMTGSGKTGLGIVLLEEALRAGVPVIAVDPKGDLTNLCLTFPDLAPADFRPWIDEAQARNAGQTPDEFAAAQATTWRAGLAGWGLGGGDIGALRAAVDFTIYTPGSEAGVPLNLVGSLQVPADMTDTEAVADEIESYVSGLLGLVGIAADPLSSREHILLSNLVQHAWSQGTALDLMTLIGMVPSPPIRKLGVFDVDQFFPADDRMALALKLNGLLASPSFGAWTKGQPLDVQSMLYGPDGRARCAIVTTAHLSDEERQFVTTLVLSKLVTWMRRQSGTTDLRAMLYMDEVAGYVPPSAMPPTKKPIMLLMKQARAFGLGVVLSTQNPVDLDYKAISNAGTWMIGRLQTERDKARLVEGMASASGAVDVGAIDATISGLAKREFLIRRAGRDEPQIITTRWAMSYLRGPMTRDQIELLTPDVTAVATEITAPASPSTTTPPGSTHPTAGTTQDTPPVTSPDTSPVAPEIARGIAVRYVDPAAPWLGDVGGDSMGTTLEPAIVARVAVRYDETKADLVHDDEYEAVLFPLTDPPDVTRLVQVDHDERDLREEAPARAMYRLGPAPLGTAAWFAGIERDLRDHLTQTLTIEIPVNTKLKLYGRPGESGEEFASRCDAAADERADAEIAALRSKYEARATKLRDQIDAAEDRADVVEAQAADARRSDYLSSAGSLLGGLLGGRTSKRRMLGDLVGDAGRVAGSGTGADRRVDEARNKVARLTDQYADLEAELEQEVVEIAQRWDAAAAGITSMRIGLERTDVRVTHLALAWLPVP